MPFKTGGVMAVLRLVPRSRDTGTVRVLRALLKRAEEGELVGVVLSYRMRSGQEDAIYTGVYQTRKAEALQAAMGISWRLTRMHDEMTGPP